MWCSSTRPSLPYWDASESEWARYRMETGEATPDDVWRIRDEEQDAANVRRRRSWETRCRVIEKSSIAMNFPR